MQNCNLLIEPQIVFLLWYPLVGGLYILKNSLDSFIYRLIMAVVSLLHKAMHLNRDAQIYHMVSGSLGCNNGQQNCYYKFRID